jgi:hypothetical protein
MDPHWSTIVLVFFLSDPGETGFLEYPPTSRPIERCVPDYAFNAWERACSRYQGANCLRRIPTPLR